MFLWQLLNLELWLSTPVFDRTNTEDAELGTATTTETGGLASSRS